MINEQFHEPGSNLSPKRLWANVALCEFSLVSSIFEQNVAFSNYPVTVQKHQNGGTNDLLF